MTLASDISTTSTSLSDIKNAIIAKGVTPSGNITTYATAISSIPSGGSKYGANGDTFLGDVNANGVYQYPSPNGSIDLVFTGVKTIGTSIYSGATLHYAFYDNPCIKSASFPDLEDIVKIGALNYCFYYCNYMTTVSFPKLKTISASNAMSHAFDSTNIEEINFEALETITGTTAFQNCLHGYSVATSSKLKKCYFPKLSDVNASGIFSLCFALQFNLTDVYFNALTTSSFGSYTNQFDSLMSQTGSTVTHTIHFPSNLESTIQGLTGYPLFGGTSGYVVLAFDLPATS